MAGQMWFGTPGYMTWVPCPRTGMGMSKQRWSTSGTYLNGGGYARSSTYGHQQYDMAWEMITSAQSELLESYIDGLYGDGLIYFMDPFTMAGNVLPTNWAAPGQIERGAPSITTTTPTTFAAAAANTLGYPARTVTPVAAGNTRTLYIP